MPEVCGVSGVAVMGEAEAQHRKAAESRGRADVTRGGGAVFMCHTGRRGHADMSHGAVGPR